MDRTQTQNHKDHYDANKFKHKHVTKNRGGIWPKKSRLNQKFRIVLFTWTALFP